MAQITIDIISQMKDGIVLPVWHDAKNDPPAKVVIEENLVPRFRYLDDAVLMKNNRLFFF